LEQPAAFIGDIHGDSLRLLSLLSRPEIRDRRLIFLGDYIDHGPDARLVIEVLLKVASDRPDAIFLCGNHEIGLLAFLSGKLSFLEYAWMGGLPTIRSYLGRAEQDVRLELVTAFPLPHYEFLSACKPFFETKDYFASHAGVNPASPESRDLADVVLGRHVSLFHRHNELGMFVVCGHYLQTSHQPYLRGRFACLNTGCGTTGGPATALLYPEMTFVQS
jgi:serine/threonine protein phosphatase 1